MNKPRILVGAVLAVALVVGLYLLNRYWIAPVGSQPAKAAGGGPHPMAPAFSVTDIFGQKLDMSDFRGKVVLLDFWATWCGPCRIEIPGFVDLQRRYGQQGLAVVGLAVQDTEDAVREFYTEYKMNYRVALVAGGLEELYGVNFGLPTTFLIGRDGRIYAKHQGAVNPELVEEEIKELLAGKATQEVADFKSTARSEAQIELGDPEAVNSEVPGINLSKLTAAQKEQYKKILQSEQCTCGCKFNLLKCRIDDRSCATSLRLAREQLDKLLKSSI